MNSKNPGEGLHTLWEIISKGIEYRWEQIVQKFKFFRNWLHLPPACHEHGRQHLFAQRLGDEEPNYHCHVKGCTWRSEGWGDWMSKREDYLSEKCPCDNWECDKKHL